MGQIARDGFHFVRFSALQRAEIAEIALLPHLSAVTKSSVSVLFNEPKLLKSSATTSAPPAMAGVSVLFNEPKLLKCRPRYADRRRVPHSFSALQRAEIAEILCAVTALLLAASFSALQRAEIAEMCRPDFAFQCRRMFQCSSTSRNC